MEILVWIIIAIGMLGAVLRLITAYANKSSRVWEAEGLLVLWLIAALVAK